MIAGVFTILILYFIFHGLPNWPPEARDERDETEV